ncbi:MAG: glycoside hydrolase family 28 protein [Acidobacteriaceae bacterium]|nr:glycoside hydrolase family 28 protein [Acidobacteriaceae bacterium]
MKSPATSPKRRFATALLLTSLGLAAHAQKVCDATAFGAKADGQSVSTTALQKALDGCAHGGTVTLAGGVFLSGPLVLPSGVTLKIAKDATLAASPNHEDFPEMEEFHDRGRQSLLSAKDASDIVITGGGTIDGRGDTWWNHRDEKGYTRPRLVVFDHCKHVLMEDVLVENSPMWQIVPYYSDDVTFRNMKVYAPQTSHNTDGIDPFSSTHVLIDHVTIDTGDDNIAIKSGQPGSPGPDAPSAYITIRDCVMLHGHGLSIGSEIAGGVQHVLAERIHFKGTGTGIRIKSNRDRGGDIGDFTYRDIEMEDVGTAVLISAFYPKVPPTIEQAPLTRLTPHFHDITLENVKATGAKEAMLVVGLPEAPIRGLRLRNVQLSAQKGARLQYAEVGVKEFNVKAATGPGIATGAGMTTTTK